MAVFFFGFRICIITETGVTDSAQVEYVFPDYGIPETTKKHLNVEVAIPAENAALRLA